MVTIPPDNVLSLPAAEARRRAAIFVNHLRNCISSCKRTLVENLQEAQSDVAGKLSQSIYWVESILSKCHEEGDLLFFTIRSETTHDTGRRSSWFKSLPLFGRGSSNASCMPTQPGATSMPGITSVAAASAAQSAKMKSSCLVEVVIQWTPQQVTQWLESIGLPMYSYAFLDHEISGRELLSLERRDFKDVGVTKVGHIKRLQHGIKDIQQGKLPPRLLQSSCTTKPSDPIKTTTSAESSGKSPEMPGTNVPGTSATMSIPIITTKS